MGAVPGQGPVVALTVGDVTGIGPELVLAALARETTYSSCRPIVIGTAQVLSQQAAALGSSVEFVRVRAVSEAAFEPGRAEVVEPDGVPELSGTQPGQVDPRAGKLAALCLELAFQLAAAGEVEAVVGAPLHKQAFKMAGYHYLDEMAFLAELTASAQTRLFGILGPLWTTCTTLHVAFKDIAALVTKKNVLEAIEGMHAALRRAVGDGAPIAVAALNPHNGEGGTMGREEIDEIAPAVVEARSLGIAVSGPFPADTVFPRAFAEGFRGVVCMHHDQANVARKLHGFADSATAFLGLPVPYATTAHGTAFDLVGRGVADPSSFLAALRFAVGQCGRVAPSGGSATGQLSP